MFSHILVAVDGSEHARAALQLATRLAAEQRASLTVLAVISTPHVLTTELDVAPLDPRLVDGIYERLRASTRQWLDRWLAEDVPQGLPCTPVLREGHPPEEILAQVEDGGHDLLVMGAHGRSGLRGALVGSVTGRVIRSCPTPVLVAR